MIVLGLHLKDGHRITGMLGDPVMQRMFELGRKAGNIAMCYIEIIRFQELDSGALLAVIDPEADVLAFDRTTFFQSSATGELDDL